MRQNCSKATTALNLVTVFDAYWEIYAEVASRLYPIFLAIAGVIGFTLGRHGFWKQGGCAVEQANELLLLCPEQPGVRSSEPVATQPYS